MADHPEYLLFLSKDQETPVRDQRIFPVRSLKTVFFQPQPLVLLLDEPCHVPDDPTPILGMYMIFPELPRLHFRTGLVSKLLVKFFAPKISSRMQIPIPDRVIGGPCREHIAVAADLDRFLRAVVLHNDPDQIRRPIQQLGLHFQRRLRRRLAGAPFL